MSILGKIADYFRSGKSDGGTDKFSFVTQMEDIEQTMKSVSAALADSSVKTRLSQIIKSKNPTGSDATFKNLYNGFFGDLDSKSQRVERSGIFNSVRQALEIGAKDLEDLRTHIDDVFGVGTSDIDLSSIRMSGATVMGFVEMLSDLSDWTSYMLNIGLSHESDSVPPYQSDVVDALQNSAVQVIGVILNRGRTNIIDDIQSIQNSGKDLNITAGGHFIDSYASDNDYTPRTLTMSSNFGRSWILANGSRKILKEKAKAEQRKAQREFMRNRVALTQLEMSNTDPNSDRYQHLQKVVNNYRDMIAELDQKIEKYETAS